jgi:hypothetical protein
LRVVRCGDVVSHGYAFPDLYYSAFLHAHLTHNFV